MKLKHNILAIVAAVTLALVPATMLAGTAFAACGNTKAAQEVLEGAAQAGASCNDAPVDHIFAVVVNILSIIVGAVAVIAILYAGFKYISSGGEQGRVANAKSTLLYALVGLAVAALAQFMIHFVLFQATDAVNAKPQCPAGQQGTPPNCHN